MKKSASDVLNSFVILFGILGLIAMLSGAGIGIAWKLGAQLYEVQKDITILFAVACACWFVAVCFCIAETIREYKEAKRGKNK